MIAMLLALQGPAAVVAPAPAPSSQPPVLGGIGQQSLPASGCAAFLWSSAGDRTLVAMATATPAGLRLAIDGRPPVDLVLTSGEGATSFGFPGSATYKAGEVTATLAMTISNRSDLAAGAVVPEGALTVELPGRDTVVQPVAGLIGCAT